MKSNENANIIDKVTDLVAKGLRKFRERSIEPSTIFIDIRIFKAMIDNVRDLIAMAPVKDYDAFLNTLYGVKIMPLPIKNRIIMYAEANKAKHYVEILVHSGKLYYHLL